MLLFKFNNKKHEVDDVTSDAGKKDLVAMIYIEALNKSYKEDEKCSVITRSHNLKYVPVGELSFLTGSMREEKLRLVGMVDRIRHLKVDTFVTLLIILTHVQRYSGLK
ncbi:hypothetical protein P8452_18491 [Trifolium repens]|nr:hypothetical protein P8452_18491 [Trifolium repens]